MYGFKSGRVVFHPLEHQQLLGAFPYHWSCFPMFCGFLRRQISVRRTEAVAKRRVPNRGKIIQVGQGVREERSESSPAETKDIHKWGSF
uniref:Uncharacterized protein n=1 Tax=Cucumis sativus TaxID=3659 RepID=A0A0A0LML3_CUCSA